MWQIPSIIPIFIPQSLAYSNDDAVRPTKRGIETTDRFPDIHIAETNIKRMRIKYMVRADAS